MMAMGVMESPPSSRQATVKSVQPHDDDVLVPSDDVHTAGSGDRSVLSPAEGIGRSEGGRRG